MWYKGGVYKPVLVWIYVDKKKGLFVCKWEAEKN